MRRVTLTALITGAIVASIAAIAWAAPASITNVGDTFSAPTYAHDGGTVGQFVHAGGNPHNVTASGKGPDGKALFSSATISSGSAPVNGTQYLAAGPYPFICTIHPTTMIATLNVTGTPLPRPTASVKILSKKLKPVAKSGKLKLNTTLTGATSAELTAKLGAKTLGTGAVGAGVAKLKLTAAGKKALAAKKTAKVAVTAAVDFGSPSTATAKLK